MTTIAFERLRLRRQDAGDAPAELSGGIDHLFAGVQTSLERERERRTAVRAEQAACLAEALERAGGRDALCLHGRRAAGLDVDHLVVTASGVYVVGAWLEAGARVEVAFAGGTSRERLMVRGRDKTAWVNGLVAQHDAVRAALAAYPVPVRGLMLFLDAQLPTIWAPTIEDYPVVDAVRAAELLRAPGPVDHSTRRRVWRALSEAFPGR